MKGLFNLVAEKMANVKAAIVAKKTVFWKCPEESSYPLISGEEFFDLLTSQKFAEAELAYGSIYLSNDYDRYVDAYGSILALADIGFRTQNTKILDWCYRMEYGVLNCWIVSDGTPLDTYGNSNYPITKKWLEDHGALREYTSY